MEVIRGQLVGRVLHAAPRLICVFAPAGYGKSTFVRQLMPKYGSSVVCDLMGSRGPIDVARQLIAALATVRSGEAETIALGQLSLPNERLAWQLFAQHLWRESTTPECIVFENAESLIEAPGATLAFEEILHDSTRVIIVCSRVPLNLPYGHGLAPPEVLYIRQGDLQFTQSELEQALPHLSGADRRVVGRVSHGWPVVVSLIARLIAQEGLSTIAARLEDIVHDELYEYLASQLFATVSPDELDVMLALAAIPDANQLDIERALRRDVFHELQTIRERVPLAVYGSRHEHRLHPMLAQFSLQRYPSRCDQLIRLSAQAAAADGDGIRAAQLHLHIGDKHAAAAAIQDVGPYLMSTPSLPLANIISSLDGESLIDFPKLWCAAMMHRGFSVPPEEWLRMARHIWEQLPSESDPAVRASVLASLLNAHTNMGLCKEARELLDAFRGDACAGDRDTYMVTLLFTAALESFDGLYENLPHYTQELTPVFEASPLTHGLYLYDVISPMYQARGEQFRADQTLARACEQATTLSAGGLPILEAAFAAWFNGDDRLFESYVERLETILTPGNSRGYSFFIECARGRGASAPFGYEKVKTRAQALMIASACSRTVTEARSLSRNAVVTADASSRRFLRILARVALAELVPEERTCLLSDAIEISEGIQSQPMRDALRAMRSGSDEVGMLKHFVSRYSSAKSYGAGIVIRALAGEVCIRGAPVKLTPCEFGILAALARETRWHDAAELCDYLYPELDSEAAANRLHVYVHRVRQRLSQDVIQGGNLGYRLGATVKVDLWEAEALLRNHSDEKNRLTEHERIRAAALTPLTGAELSALAARARLPITLEQRLGEVRRGLIVLRAKAALARHQIADVLELADTLIADDPCDADGHNFRIRSLLLEGDQMAAERAWAAYRRSLNAQLHTEPPPIEDYLDSLDLQGARTPDGLRVSYES